MKMLLLAFALIIRVAASELQFEVTDTPGDQLSKRNEYKWKVFLHAYDVFSAVVRDGVVRWTDHHDMQQKEAELKNARLVCDLERATLKVVLAEELSESEAKRITAGLLQAVAQMDLGTTAKESTRADIELLQAKVVALRDELLKESKGDLMRFRILNEQLRAIMTFSEIPVVPFPLRAK